MESQEKVVKDLNMAINEIKKHETFEPEVLRNIANCKFQLEAILNDHYDIPEEYDYDYETDNWFYEEP